MLKQKEHDPEKPTLGLDPGQAKRNLRDSRNV